MTEITDQWNPYLTAAACGVGAGLMTLARRAALSPQSVKALDGWDRWRHSLSGFFLGGGLAAGVALLAHELASAPVRIGWALCLSATLDIATSEGLAFVAKRFLKIETDEKPPYPQ
jgi:hypothetical protein